MCLYLHNSRPFGPSICYLLCLCYTTLVDWKWTQISSIAQSQSIIQWGLFPLYSFIFAEVAISPCGSHKTNDLVHIMTGPNSAECFQIRTSSTVFRDNNIEWLPLSCTITIFFSLLSRTETSRVNSAISKFSSFTLCYTMGFRIQGPGVETPVRVLPMYLPT